MFDIINVYAIVFVTTLLLTIFIRGYNGKEYNVKDIIDSLLWPLTYTVIFGVIIRAIVNKFNEKKEIDE